MIYIERIKKIPLTIFCKIVKLLKISVDTSTKAPYHEMNYIHICIFFPCVHM